jgi:hypothetical protein
MKQSNIFAYTELSKMVSELTKVSEPSLLKEKLKVQVSYFNILETRYFSDSIVYQWEEIQNLAGQKKQRSKDKITITSNANRHAIDSLSDAECFSITRKICSVFEHVEREFA